MKVPGREDGFSLMEAVVSIAIISIGFVGIYSVFVVAEKSLAKSFEKNRLMVTASSMVEEISSDQDNLDNFKEMDLDLTDGHYNNEETERKINRARKKWKKRLEQSHHKDTDQAPTKLTDIAVDGEDQNLLAVEMKGKQGVNVTFHRIYRKKEQAE